MSTIPKRKYKRSDIEANYRNETKTFWCVPKKENERFYLVQKLGVPRAQKIEGQVRLDYSPAPTQLALLSPICTW
jgi:hypothetical protein